MALGDYILCCKCECKLIYDGHRDLRDRWVDLFGEPPKIECPDCKAQQQEPVAWMWKFDDEGAAFSTREPTASIKDGVNYVPLYTAPPQGEWVGLTDEEIKIKHIGKLDWDSNYVGIWYDFARAIEANLKEKNT